MTTSIEKVIPARDIPRGQSPMELLTPREMSQTTETRLPAETNRVTIPDPSDTLGDPVVEQTVRKLIETAGRLVANKNAPGSGVTAPYGTIDDTGRVQLSQTVIRQGMSNVTPLMGNSRIPERKVRKMPAKKVSRVIDVQKKNQLKYNFTGVPETDPRACFNRATWSPAVNLQQPPLGTSHLILGDSLVRVLSNLRTSWVTTVMAFGGATIAQLYRMVELMNPGKIPNVMILVGTNDISRGSDEQEALWESMMVCLFTTLWQKFNCAVLTVCTVPMNARSLTASGRRHNEGVMRWNNILRNLANRNAGRMILMDIEHELRAMDQARLTTDGIHFDSVEGQAWLNRVFQERLDELEAELFDTGVLKEEGTVSDTVITTFVPPNLETRLGTVPAVTNYRQQSSGEPGRRTDVQDRLGEAPMRRTIHPRKRIGPVNQPIEEVAGTSRSDTRSETTSTSREERPSRGSLMWSRPIPSPWHINKEELMKLDLQRVSFIEDARRMLNGATLSVSRLYSITGVDWLIAASINFSSTTALRFADLEGLPSNNTIGPVNARPLQDVRLNHDERNREERPGRFLTARAPIGQHVKIFRQLTTPPGHVKERVYPKLVNQDGDAQRYGGLTAIKKDETIFAAYDKAEMRKAKIMVVANSEFVYTSKSLFWPDVIMLAAVDLDLLQSVSLAIGVQRQTEMNPITIVFAGINDHLHSRGFLSRLRDPATAENAVWPAIKDILESMGEVVDATKEGSFNKVTLRVVFALSPGYAHLPDGLKFVYAMVALLSEGKFDVIISAPNRMIEIENLRPLKAELPAVWSDISNAMRGFKDHALHMLVLDEVLGLELSNFSRQLKLKPGIDDDHRVITAMSNDLWFRAMEVASEDTRRKNSLETRAHLEAMVLRTKPEANQWLHLNPRVAALGADAFQQGPVMITKIHAYLLKEVNLAENAGEKTAEFVNRMCQVTLETLWTQEVKGQEGFERTDSMLEGLGAGWTASFLAKVYPKVSHYLIKEFLQAVVKVSIVELIALFVTFGAENFVKGPAILLTDGIQNLRLDGLLTLIAITHGNLGGLMKLARCPEQMKERVRNLDMKKSTDSWNKIRDLRHTLIQYLLQQNRFGTGEDETIEREEDVRRHVGGMPLLTDLSLAMRIDPLALIRGVTEFVTVIYGPAVTFAFPDVKVEAYSRSVLHLNLISAVDGSTLNWCEQHALRELMSEDLLFAKISEPEMTVINFDDHFCDRMGEVERGHIEVFPKLWNLRPYDKTNGEMTRVPRLTAAYHKVREETKDWGDYKKLPEAIPEFPLIRRMLLGAVSVVQTPRLRAFETNERRVGNFSATMDPYFVGRNAAVLQYTRFAYTDQATRRRISNAATPKPEGFDEEWRGLGLAPMRMRGRTELPEASVILTSVRKEMKAAGVLQTRIFLAPFGCEEIKVVHGEEEDKSAGTLLIPRFQEEADKDEQGPSNSNSDKSEGDDGQGGNRQTEEPMQQDQAGGEDDRASTGGTSSLDFNIFSDLENNADTLETTEPADEGISTLEPPSAFEEMKRNLPESSSPGNTRNNDQRILMESPRRRRIEASARVPFLGTLPEEEWEVHHRDHESRTGCKLDRVAFMEEVWTVIQSYGTQSILKTGLNQPLMREVLDKLDECEGRLSELLIDSATDESEVNSPIKMTPQDNEGEVVYLSRTRRGTMRSKMVIDKINAMRMKLGSRVMPRRIGKTKVDSEISMKAGNSAKRKRVEEVMDLGQGDYQLSGTDRILTDIAMVPPILMAGIKSTGYKSKRSDRTLTGATLEMEILSQCGESKMRDFKPSPMNHGKGSVAGQLTPVEYNRLTVSETVSIDEPTGGYMEMLEYRNSARGYVMALEDEKAMEGYLEMKLQGTTLKQKAYGTLASSDVEAETIEQLVSLPWKAVVLRYFEEEMRTTPRIHALVAVPYVRTELQLRLAWCMMGLTREEYDSEERKRSKEEKVFLMTNLRDLIVQEGAAVACAKRRDALCFIRFLIEQISVPALSTCVKMLKEGDERTKAMFLLAMLDMQQSKPMRVNMKEPEELEPMKKIDEIRRFSNKELRLTKESMGALPKSSEYCGPIKKKSYSYVSGIIGIAYNPFLSEDIRDCFFDYEQAVLLRFWTSRIVTTKSVNNPQAKLGLVLEEEVTAPSVPKSDKRVEFGLGFSDELLRTSLMAVWELMKPSWCPSPNADSILRATQDIQRELNADCNLRDLNIIYNVMITASKSNGEDKVELPGWGPEDWVKPGSCLAEVCGLEGHVCGSLDCVKTLEKQHKQLTVLFGNVVMKARTETELIADCHGGTDVNLVTALGFYSMCGSLESLLNLEQKHEMVTAISVEVFPGVLQTEQKYIGKWREAIETEMNIRHSETYCRPSGAQYLVGSTLAPMCKSRYPVHFVAVERSWIKLSQCQSA